MGDWFETRFREPVAAGQPDPAFVARMRALVVEEWQADAGATPPTDTDTGDREGDILMLETEDRPTGHEPMTPRWRSPGRWLLVAAAVAVVAVVGSLLVAAGGDEDSLDTAKSSTSTTPTRAGSNDGCPLTAEDVSNVLGATVTGPESPTVCYFASGLGIIPSASFNSPPASACTQESLREQGYLDAISSIGPVDGLRVDAHSRRASLGVTVLVCNGDQPFEVHVEFDGDSEAAAVALAEIVLDG